jgi:acyl dehydratase
MNEKSRVGSRCRLNRADMSHMPMASHAGRIAAGGAVVAALALALVLAGCGRPTAPADGPEPASLAKADPLIESLQPTPRGVRVVARFPAPDMAGDSVRAASRVARQIARAVQAGARDLPPGATVITLELYGVDVDKFGKRTPGRLFETDFDVGDLMDLDLEAMGPAAVLDTAIDLNVDHAGIDPINAWCMRYPHVGGEWCDMAGAND